MNQNNKVKLEDIFNPDLPIRDQILMFHRLMNEWREEFETEVIITDWNTYMESLKLFDERPFKSK